MAYSMLLKKKFDKRIPKWISYKDNCSKNMALKRSYKKETIEHYKGKQIWPLQIAKKDLSTLTV